MANNSFDDINNHLFIHEENIEFKKQLNSELLIQNKILKNDNNGTMQDGRIKNEEDSNNIKMEQLLDKNNDITRKSIKVEKQSSFSCEFCNKTFSYRFHLIEHVMIHTGEKPFSCDFCNKTFSRQRNLDQHRRIHTDDKHKSSHSVEKRFLCDMCNKTFSTRSHLSEHKRTHTGEKPFLCDMCNATFNRKSSLNRHKQLMHNREKPFSLKHLHVKVR
ncbi:gastrula zinc finger protein XlCGF71.1-like [Chrysoperla carnea]|uniref:gastrula zinc finger protein XlCGF71.1-like n=1 Tax=Chrysoperla carnea TaxID=189513 RepID=UPI001D068865|nr:gastrula zinc finger protein XlCGF71.1-like [Chrysoperla carnea]